MTPDEIRALGAKELEAIAQGKVTDADLVALVLGGLIVDCLREQAAQVAEIKDLLKPDEVTGETFANFVKERFK